jgi:hypothetical protein
LNFFDPNTPRGAPGKLQLNRPCKPPRDAGAVTAGLDDQPPERGQTLPDMAWTSLPSRPGGTRRVSTRVQVQ